MDKIHKVAGEIQRDLAAINAMAPSLAPKRAYEMAVQTTMPNSDFLSGFRAYLEARRHAGGLPFTADEAQRHLSSFFRIVVTRWY